MSLIRTRYQGTKTQWYLHIFEDYLQNGCLLAGLACDVDVNTYCQLCTHRACYTFCDDILGQLLYDGFIKETNELLNLADLCAIIQQQIIRPDVFNNCGERVKRIHAQIGGNPPRF